MRSLLLIYLCMLCSEAIDAQSAIYAIARDYQSPRSSAMGGYMMGMMDDDVSLLHFNPALLNGEMNHKAMIHQSYLYSGVRSGSVSYARVLKDTTLTVGGGLSYMDYGDFTRANEVREVLGSFSGGDLVATAAVSKLLVDRLRIGLSAKYISSRLAEYTSHGLLMDVGVSSTSSDHRSTWSIVLLGVGGQISRYDDVRDAIPIDIRIGWTYRLRHLPFWLSLTAHDIDRWHLDRIKGSETPQAPVISFFDDLARHIAIGGELRLGKNENIALRIGYNHRQNKELSNEVYRGFEGLSYGIGIGSSRIRVDYGAARYHLAGSVHHLSISADMSRLFRKF